MASQKLIIILVLVIIYWGYDTITNADRKYSTESYWENASLIDVANVPDAALLPGSEYGSVLMFASYVNTNPFVISELLRRGSDINEVESVFSGTPLSAAASNNSNPEIIDLLIKNGANVKATISQGRTSLINAAIYNNNKGIVTALIRGGANAISKDQHGLTALDYAKKYNNQAAIDELTKLNIFNNSHNRTLGANALSTR